MKLQLQRDATSTIEEHNILASNGWRLLTGKEALVLTPLVDAIGQPDVELPLNDHLRITPVVPEPDLTKEFPDETEDQYQMHVAWAKQHEEQPLTREQHKPWANEELLRTFGPPEGEFTGDSFDPPAGGPFQPLSVWEMVAFHANRPEHEAESLIALVRFRTVFRSAGIVTGRLYLAAVSPDALNAKDAGLLAGTLTIPQPDRAPVLHPSESLPLRRLVTVKMAKELTGRSDRWLRDECQKRRWQTNELTLEQVNELAHEANRRATNKSRAMRHLNARTKPKSGH